MIERVSQMPVGVEGSGLVELFDERTGRKVYEQPFENFLASGFIDYQKYLVRKSAWMDSAAVRTATQITDFDQLPVTNTLYLTNDTAAEDSVNEVGFRIGISVVGYSFKSTYSGSDTKRGSLNLTDTVYTPTQAKWVFDWTTASGNGTINSVGWAKMDEYTVATYGVEQQAQVIAFHGGVTGTLLPYQAAINLADGALWRGDGISATNVIRNPNWRWQNGSTTPNPETTMFTITGGTRDRCINGTNDRLWVVGATTPYTVGSFLLTATGAQTISGFANPGGTTTPTNLIAHDGTDLWLTTQGSSPTVYRVSEAGTALSNWTATGISPLHLTYDRTIGAVVIADSVYIYYYSRTGTLLMQKANFQYAHTAGPGLTPSGYSGYSTPGNQAYPSLTWTGTAYQHVMGAYWGQTTYGRVDARTLGTRALLATPVVKDSSRTMKVTYTFNFT